MKAQCIACLTFACIPFVSSMAACPQLPYSFTNGTTADASQINGDFQSVVTCFAPLNGPTFSGHVGIGTTNPPAALTVITNGDTQTTSEGTPGQLTLTTGTNGQSLYLSYDGTRNVGFIEASQSGSLQPIVLQPRGGNVGLGTTTPQRVLDVNGTAGGTSAWISTSDGRLKTDVVPITNALSITTHLQGVRFRWKTSDERTVGKTLDLPKDGSHLGFIAQDVAKLVPEAVSVPAAGSTETYGLRGADLIPVLVEAIKEQQKQISKLTIDLNALKRRSQ